jgi:hypothetical protein
MTTTNDEDDVKHMSAEQWFAIGRAAARQTDPNSAEVQRWRAVRKAAGLQIDPETAEVVWTYAQTLDPYGVYPELPEEYQQVGREYFARAPGTNVWVDFGDLPPDVHHALWEKHKSKLAFPAGLEELLTPHRQA